MIGIVFVVRKVNNYANNHRGKQTTVSYFAALSFVLMLAQSNNASFIASGVGMFIATFFNFCVMDIFNLAKVPVQCCA